MGDAAGAVHGLNLEPFFEPLQPVPEPLPAAQHDRHHDNVQVVDQAGGQEFADGGRAAADADIPASGRLARLRKRLGGAGVEEVNVVPPFIRTAGRRWWVRTKTGVRNGGLSPHRPGSLGPARGRGAGRTCPAP